MLFRESNRLVRQEFDKTVIVKRHQTFIKLRAFRPQFDEFAITQGLRICLAAQCVKYETSDLTVCSLEMLPGTSPSFCESRFSCGNEIAFFA